MITSFTCKKTAQVFDGKAPKGLPASLVRRAIVKLDQLNSTTLLNDLRIPASNYLEALTGDRLGLPQPLLQHLLDQCGQRFAFLGGSRP